MTLHSIIRATEDVDILIEDSMENFRRVIEGLSNLADGAARQLKPEDLAENVVVKIADEVEVDVTTKAWTVTYAEAIEKRADRHHRRRAGSLSLVARPDSEQANLPGTEPG